MTLKEEYEYCKENDIDFILTKDKIEEIDNTGKSINGIEDLVMVHKTDFAPKGRINSSLEANATMTFTPSFYIDGEEKSFSREINKYRNTVHFSLNGQARAHEYHPRLDDMKYCVFTPLSCNTEKVIGGTETDIYTAGGIDLGNDSFILCPKNEIKTIKENNPNSTVVGYEGENVTLYADVFLSQVLGYKFKKPTNKGRCWNLKESEDIDLVADIFKQNNWNYADHFYSEEMKNEDLETEIDKLIATIQIIIGEKLLYDEKNIKSIKDKLEREIGFEGIFSMFPNKDEYISNRVEEKIGIKLVTKENPFNENSKSRIMSSEELTSILRYVALTKKHELGTLTDSEKNSFLKELDISKLKDEEKDYFIDKINSDLQNKSFIGEFIPSLKRNTDNNRIEMVLSFPENFYGVANSDLETIIAGATQNDDIYSLSASLRDSNLSLKENFYKFIDFAKDYPNSHIKGITEDGKIITDFAISNNSSFKELEAKTIEYRKSLAACYYGENGFAKETVNKSQVEHK